MTVTGKKQNILTEELTPLRLTLAPERTTNPIMTLGEANLEQLRASLKVTRRGLFLGRDAEEVLMQTARITNSNTRPIATLSELGETEQLGGLILSRRTFLEALKTTVQAARLLTHVPLSNLITNIFPQSINELIDDIWKSKLLDPDGNPDIHWGTFTGKTWGAAYTRALDTAIKNTYEGRETKSPIIHGLRHRNRLTLQLNEYQLNKVLSLEKQFDLHLMISKEVFSSVPNTQYRHSEIPIIMHSLVSDLTQVAIAISARNLGIALNSAFVRDMMTQYRILKKGYLLAFYGDKPYVLAKEA